MWDINIEYEFKIINPLQNILGIKYTGTLQAIINYTQVINYGDVNTLFSQISYLIPNKPKLEDLQYLVFRLSNGELFVIPECYIDLLTVKKLNSLTLNFKISGINATDITFISTIISDLGYNDYSIYRLL